MKAAPEPDADRLFAIFSDLVKLSSESGHEGAVSAYIKGFCARLGAVCQEDSAGAATGGECGNLIVRVPAGAFNPLHPVILNAHMDTVRPGKGIMPIDAGDRFMSGGMTVLGADDKAGIAAILTTYEMLSATGARNRALELVFTIQEEPGLIGAKNLDASLLDGKWGLVLDHSGPVGGIVTRAPGRDLLRFTVRGRAAHAGYEPEKGRNAIHCACEAVAACGSGRIDESTTLNLGTISGGIAANIVPEEAQVEGEVRSLSVERLADVTDGVIGAFRDRAAARGCELVECVERSFEPFTIDTSSTPVVLLARAMKDCEVEPRFEASGGGSDANVLNKTGFTMLNIGIGLADAHSKQESIIKKDLLDTVRVISRLALISTDEEAP